jgi:uncharacterized protein YraI
MNARRARVKTPVKTSATAATSMGHGTWANYSAAAVATAGSEAMIVVCER